MREGSIRLRGVIVISERTVATPEPEEGKVMVPLYNIPMMPTNIGTGWRNGIEKKGW